MNRREALNTAGIALLTAAIADLSPTFGTSEAVAQGTRPAAGIQPTFQLTKKENVDEAMSFYQASTKRRTAGPPYVYAYYDDASKKFLNPLDLVPSLVDKEYTLEPKLYAFNIKTSDQQKFKNLKDEVQLGFNATTQVTKSDQLTWIFMNAIDIFLAKDQQGRQDQLTKFTAASGKSGIPLQAEPKIKVVNGLVNLQVIAFGQRQRSFWTNFFDVLTKVLGSPVVSTAIKGFGVPALASQALTFVDGVLDVIAEENKLVNLWKTGSLEFAVTQTAKAVFKMKPGIWAIVDSDYAHKTNFLQNHEVDLQYQSFRIVDKSGVPADANYLVTDLKFN